jgi:hypothetical protein
VALRRQEDVVEGVDPSLSKIAPFESLTATILESCSSCISRAAIEPALPKP